MMWWMSVAHADYLPLKASTVAGDVDNVFNFILILSIISFVILMAGMAYFIVKYRRRSDSDKVAYISHNHLAEALWSGIPFILFMAIFAWGYWVYHEMRTFPKDALEINVAGKKWAWTMNYKNGATLVNELVVPAGKPVVLNLTAEDVLHSFYVPSFRVKQDAVPGKLSKLGFTATEPGDYRIFCAEYCGTQHSQMIGWVKVLSQPEYAAWEQKAASAGEMSPVEKGAQLYKTQACFTCHSLDGSRVVGPSFKGLWGKTEKLVDGSSVQVDEAYVRESILNPNAKVVDTYPPAMPPYQGRITEEEITNLIEYMKTIN